MSFMIDSIGSPRSGSVAPDWMEPLDSVQLSIVAWEHEWVSEWLTANCMQIRGRKHTLETLSFQIPASEQNGCWEGSWGCSDSWGCVSVSQEEAASRSPRHDARSAALRSGRPSLQLLHA
jgi:hypothetical protein